jgi:hypothetical protein
MSDFKINEIVKTDDGIWVHLVTEPNSVLFQVGMFFTAALIFFCMKVFGGSDFSINLFFLIPIWMVLSIILAFVPFILISLTAIMGVVYWIM